MQKVLQRTSLAKSQAKRKARILAEKQQKKDNSLARRERLPIQRELNAAVRREKFRRRDDWELGPLSPWRNDMQSMLESGFGTFSTPAIETTRSPVKRGTGDWLIREGDRVCVVEGHPSIKGRIGKVVELLKKYNAVAIDGINRVDIIRPTDMKITTGDESQAVAQHSLISYDNIRLVYPLPDPQTGIPREVIINNLVLRGRHFNVFDNEEIFDRYLEPQNVRIPWPEKTEPIYKDEEGDTLRLQADENTYTPTLISPPMPGTVIDELRNRYGIFRDRHDDEYIEKKIQEDIATEAEQLRKKSMMPRGARNIAGPRFSKGKPWDKGGEVPDDLAASIGARMASRTSIAP